MAPQTFGKYKNYIVEEEESCFLFPYHIHLSEWTSTHIMPYGPDFIHWPFISPS